MSEKVNSEASPILIADDDVAMTDCYGELLKSIGLKLIVTTSQTEAREFLAAGQKLSLVLIDHSLEGQSATEFVLSLQKEFPLLGHTTPIAVFSGHSHSGPVAAQVMAAGIRYIEKPNDIDEFIQIIEEIIARSKPA